MASKLETQPGTTPTILLRSSQHPGELDTPRLGDTGWFVKVKWTVQVIGAAYPITPTATIDLSYLGLGSAIPLTVVYLSTFTSSLGLDYSHSAWEVRQDIALPITIGPDSLKYAISPGSTYGTGSGTYEMRAIVTVRHPSATPVLKSSAYATQPPAGPGAPGTAYRGQYGTVQIGGAYYNYYKPAKPVVAYGAWQGTAPAAHSRYVQRGDTVHSLFHENHYNTGELPSLTPPLYRADSHPVKIMVTQTNHFTGNTDSWGGKGYTFGGPWTAEGTNIDTATKTWQLSQSLNIPADFMYGPTNFQVVATDAKNNPSGPTAMWFYIRRPPPVPGPLVFTPNPPIAGQNNPVRIVVPNADVVTLKNGSGPATALTRSTIPGETNVWIGNPDIGASYAGQSKTFTVTATSVQPPDGDGNPVAPDPPAISTQIIPILAPAPPTPAIITAVFSPAEGYPLETTHLVLTTKTAQGAGIGLSGNTFTATIPAQLGGGTYTSFTSTDGKTWTSSAPFTVVAGTPPGTYNATAISVTNASGSAGPVSAPYKVKARAIDPLTVTTQFDPPSIEVGGATLLKAHAVHPQGLTVGVMADLRPIFPGLTNVTIGGISYLTNQVPIGAIGGGDFQTALMNPTADVGVYKCDVFFSDGVNPSIKKQATLTITAPAVNNPPVITPGSCKVNNLASITVPADGVSHLTFTMTAADDRANPIVTIDLSPLDGPANTTMIPLGNNQYKKEHIVGPTVSLVPPSKIIIMKIKENGGLGREDTCLVAVNLTNPVPTIQAAWTPASIRAKGTIDPGTSSTLVVTATHPKGIDHIRVNVNDLCPDIWKTLIADPVLPNTWNWPDQFAEPGTPAATYYPTIEVYDQNGGLVTLTQVSSPVAAPPLTVTTSLPDLSDCQPTVGPTVPRDGTSTFSVSCQATTTIPLGTIVSVKVNLQPIQGGAAVSLTEAPPLSGDWSLAGITVPPGCSTGEKTLVITATDSSGGTSTCIVKVLVVVDTIPRVLQGVFEPQSMLPDGRKMTRVRCKVTDEGNDIDEVTVDLAYLGFAADTPMNPESVGSNWYVTDYFAPTIGVPVGSHTYTITAMDDAANVVTGPATFEVLPNHPPVIISTTPNPAIVNQGSSIIIGANIFDEDNNLTSVELDIADDAFEV